MSTRSTHTTPVMNDAWRFALSSLASLLAGAVAGNRLDALVSQFMVWPPRLTVDMIPNAVLTVVFGTLAFVIAYRLAIPQFRKTFLKTIAHVTRQADARPFRAVVATLSKLDDKGIEKAEQLAAYVAAEIARGVSRTAVLDALCAKDAATAGPAYRLPWQQTLRTLRFHAARLQVLHFVLSPEAATQYPLFCRILTPLLPDGAILAPALDAAGRGVDLTSYNDVTTRIIAAGREAMARADCEHDDLCIDITGGQKIWSAAATIVTLNTASAFGYVGTLADGEGDEGRIVIFNARISG